MKKFILYPFCIAAVLVFNTCATNPVTGKKQLVLMSEEQEIALGQQTDPQVIATFGLYEDKGLQDFIAAEGKKMAAISHRPNLEYQFRIVDSDVINAFAVPGGYVYFTRGIMAHFNNEAEFAGVLGHEIGHITARHSVIQQRNQMLGQLGLIAGIIIKPELAQFAETAAQGLSLLFLKFGRDDEMESDRLGVEYSSKVGYDAMEMSHFFETLENLSPSGSEEIPDFLSTHPSPGNRKVTVRKLAEDWQKQLNLTNAQVNRNSYLKRIEGLIYGEDPKQGFVENNTFYHPVLKIQFPVPQNWSYQNTPQQVQMATKDGKALMLLRFAPGKTLQEAANGILQQYSLQVIESKQTTVNGLNAIALVADQVPQQQQQQQQQQASVRTLSYLIQQGENIYHLIGVSTPGDFMNYLSSFNNTMLNFKPLTDQSKINKKPKRIRLKTINTNTTFQQALRSLNVPDAQHKELAIVNGMELKDKVDKGTIIKIIAE